MGPGDADYVGIHQKAFDARLAQDGVLYEIPKVSKDVRGG